MNEFFDWYELDWYVANIENKNLDIHPAMEWLDEQVRANFVNGIDTEPQIESKLLEYLVKHGGM